MFSRVGRVLNNTPIHIAALASIAIAQPLFDVFGRAPEFLLAHDLGPADILVLVLLIGVAVPLLPALVVAFLQRVHPPTATVVARVLIAVFCSLIAIYAVKEGPERMWLVLAIGVSAGVAGCILYCRVAGVRAFTSWLTPGVVVFPLLFLFQPGVRALMWPSIPEVPETAATKTPVVLVVFDALPLTALLDRNGQLDRDAYPNFAALAEHATWYRNATTVNDFTRWALPAILSGRYPRAPTLPVAGDHPQTIFSLLGTSHEIFVHEPITRLCPEAVCDHDRQGAAGEVLRFGPTVFWSYLHTVLPESAEGSLPPLDQGWAEGVPPSDVPGEVWLKGGDQSRRGQAVAFIDAIDDGDEDADATLHFLHVLLPHTPLSYLPRGQRYGTERALAGLFEGRRDLWGRDDWAVTQGYRRFLLQVGYVDTLLGRVIERLKATGLYDRALIVVTADHGSAFKAGQPFRRVSDETYMDILPVPLLIKQPQQQTGRIVDDNVETVDILPTIADLLDISLPWKVDGHSLVNGAPPRTSKTVYVDDATRVRQFPASLQTAVAESVEHKFRLFGTAAENFYRIPLDSPYRTLIGRRVDDLRVSNQVDALEFSIEVHGDFSDVNPSSRYIPAHLAGRARWKNRNDPVSLAVALNGIVCLTTRTYRANDRNAANVWSLVLPPNAFRQGRNDVEVFVIAGSENAPVLYRAHFSEDRPLDLTSNAAAYGLGVTYEGFSPRDGTDEASVRWTGARASITVPMGTRRRPKSLRLFLGDSGRIPAMLEVAVNGCKVFDGNVATGARWSGIFSLSPCSLEGATAEIDLVTRRAAPSGLPAAGVPVERVEFLDYAWPPTSAALPESGRRSQLTLLNLTGDDATVTAGATVELRVANRGNAVWATPTDLKQSDGSVRLAIQWLPPNGQEPAVAVQRIELPRTLVPGDVFDLAFPLTPSAPDGSPLPPGQYQVRIGLLQEGVNWFAASGDSVRKLRVVHDARP